VVWGLRFLLECLPSRTAANTRAILSLGLYSRAALQRLREETRIAYDEQTRGILHLHAGAPNSSAPRGTPSACASSASSGR